MVRVLELRHRVNATRVRRAMAERRLQMVTADAPYAAAAAQVVLADSKTLDLASLSCHFLNRTIKKCEELIASLEHLELDYKKILALFIIWSS